MKVVEEALAKQKTLSKSPVPSRAPIFTYRVMVFTTAGGHIPAIKDLQRLRF
jgi:hypothetical protein